MIRPRSFLLLILLTALTSCSSQRSNLLHSLPPLLNYLITTLMVLGSIWTGYWLAIRNRHAEGEAETPINSVVTALMALLAFILAFTFGVSTSRYDTRRELILDEVNAIETAYLRAGLINEPHRTEVRTLLRQYVEIRVYLIDNPQEALQKIKESDQLQGAIWKHVEALAQEDTRNAPLVALFVDAINAMFDLQTKRITVGVLQHLPNAIWLALYLLTIFSMMGIGYLFGLSGRRSWTLFVLLSLAFSTVMFIISDLDRSGSDTKGVIRMDPRPLLELRERIK